MAGPSTLAGFNAAPVEGPPAMPLAFVEDLLFPILSRKQWLFQNLRQVPERQVRQSLPQNMLLGLECSWLDFRQSNHASHQLQSAH